MADIVNLQQSEYDSLITQLETVHGDAISKIEKISSDIRTLSSIDGGFYIDQISEKIATLLDTLDSGIKNPMDMNMQASCESMSDFATIISNVDSCCNI